MLRRRLSWLILLLLIVSSCVLAEETILQSGDFCYVVDGEAATIVGYLGKEETLVLPDVIEGIRVTGMGSDVFSHVAYAFPYHYESVNTATQVKELIIPASVTHIASDAFNGAMVETITVANGNEAFIVEDGVLFDQRKERLVFYPKNRSEQSFSIPDGTRTIGDYAFTDCSDIKTIAFPNSLQQIGEYAFSGCKMLQSVIFPESLKEIGSSAFANNESIASIMLPEGLEIIGDHAFAFLPLLEVIEIPRSLKSLGEYCFFYCESLNQMHIPEGLAFIGESAFRKTNVSEITIEDGNTTYEVIDGVLYDSAQKMLHTYPSQKTDTTFTIPNGTLIVAMGGFAHAGNLESILFPKSLEEVRFTSFIDCTGIISITLPDKITFLPRAVFSGCSKLENVMLPNCLEVIGPSAFQWCYSLMDINIPEKVESIGYKSFYSCGRLRKIDLPDNLLSIGVAAFGHSGLESIQLPDKITVIEESTFEYCDHLINIGLPSGLEKVKDYAFNKCRQLEKLEFPSSVEVSEKAFSGRWD